MAIDERRPRTKAEALELALRWGNTLSHHNEILAGAAEDGKQTHQQALAMIAVADAAEVARLSALHSMLPGEPLEDVAREELIAAARIYLGTKTQNQARRFAAIILEEFLNLEMGALG